MAAIASVFDQLAAGALVVLPNDCYQTLRGTVTVVTRILYFDPQTMQYLFASTPVRACPSSVYLNVFEANQISLGLATGALDGESSVG